MTANRLMALAALAGSAVVDAAGSDQWDSTKLKLARLLGNGDAKREELAGERLDETHKLVSLEPGPGLNFAREAQAERWSTRFSDLLQEDPGLETDLGAAVELIRAQLGAEMASAAGATTENAVIGLADSGAVDLRTTRQKVAVAFDESEERKVEKFLEITLSSWKKISDDITRTVVFIFLLAAVFEVLLGASNVRSLTLGPLTLSNTSLLQLFIPALVAYLLYDAYTLVARWRDHGTIYMAILNQFEPRLFESDLPRMVLPVIRGPWSLGPAFFARWTGRPTDALDFFMRVVLLLSAGFILPLAFECQAYYSLLKKYGTDNILVWISLVASVFFVAAWLLRIWTTGIEDYAVENQKMD